MHLTEAVDRYLAQLDDLRDASGGLRSALDVLDDATARAKDTLAHGTPLTELFRGRELLHSRDTILGALDRFDRSFRRTRAASIRVLVDHEGLTLREVARLVDRSRQFVSRLYHFDRLPPGEGNGEGNGHGDGESEM